MGYAKMKWPIRKVWRGSTGTLFVSIPQELGIREGDLLCFSIREGRVLVKKIGEGRTNAGDSDFEAENARTFD